jgi:hypothetical protein
MKARLIITDPYEAFEVLDGELEGPIRHSWPHLKELPAMMYNLLRVCLLLFSEGPFGRHPHPGILAVLKDFTAPDYLFKSNDGRWFRLHARHVGSSIKECFKGKEVSVNVFDLENTKAIGIGDLSPLLEL